MNEFAQKVYDLLGKVDVWTSILITVAGLAILLTLLIVAARNKWNAGIIAEVAIASALSLILSLFPLWKMPQGGSITLSMLPVLVIAFRRGVIPGLVCGLISGGLQILADPYILNIPQVLLDYGLSYTVLGFAGIRFKDENSMTPAIVMGVLGAGFIGYSVWNFIQFNGKAFTPDPNKYPPPATWLYLLLGLLILAILIACFAFGRKTGQKIAMASMAILGRFVVHFVSGFVFFAMYAWSGYENALVYSASYNLLYIIPSAILCFVVLVPLIKTGIVSRID
jgi:thiamine transporter